MEEENKLQIINEIKRIERELYLKRSQLAASEVRKYGTTRLVAQGLDVNKWKSVFSALVKIIGLHSKGGNSVEDIRMERER